MTSLRCLFVGALALWISTASPAPAAETRPRKISIAAGRKLTSEAIKRHNAGAALIYTPREWDPDFYFFCATWSNPVGSPIIGYFAVNPWTGDVWEAAGCELLTTESLKKLQARIRERSRLKEEDYRRLHAKKPWCAVE